MSKIEVNQIDVQCGSTLTVGSSGKTVQLQLVHHKQVLVELEL